VNVAVSAAHARDGEQRSRVRVVLSAVGHGLYRPLASDPDRALYFVKHVRHGVWLSEVSAAAALGYILLTSTAGHNNPLIIAFATLVIAASPAILLLPLPEMMLDRRGPLLFYAWSILDTVVVSVAARIDNGGAISPLFCLLFITLAYMAVAYPPWGVAVTGGFMTACYLLIVVLPHISLTAWFFALIMAAFTMICAMASANSWTAYERQVLLIRTQEMLAATDPLTGVPNRRPFLDRLKTAIARAETGAQSVVCLVDLDGFKAVNDRSGHAAGDALLKAVAAALGGAVRETDTVARLGGDEFAVLASVSATFSAETLAERLRGAVRSVGLAAGVTASVGVSAVRVGDHEDDVLFRADSAMYAAKTSGGDRVTLQSR
jgi:diguanylate cyclase (GGDEF)-like protein